MTLRSIMNPDRNLKTLEAHLRQTTDRIQPPPVASIPLPTRRPPATPYAPAPVSNAPARLASATIQSVGRLGDASAEEIEKIRAELKRGYLEIDGKLGELAEAVRAHAEVAQQRVNQFCLQATDVFDMSIAAIRKLHGRAERETVQVEEGAPADNGQAAPEFLTGAQDPA